MHEYIVVDSDSTIDLQRRVNDLLLEGYVFVGGIATTTHQYEDRDGVKTTYFTFFQAMAKPKSD